MTRLADVKSNKIFTVERRGRALLVTPRGDAPGFGHADFKVERERVMSLLKGGREHLIVDFGGANYFGSEMIGVVNRMVAAVRDRGGTVAVVNVSGDMREGLAIMKLDERWNLMDERRALKEVARETVFSRARRYVKPILLTLAAVTLVGGAAAAYFLVDRRYDTRDYETILVMWEELQIKQRKPQFDIELASWKRRTLDELQPLIDRLEKTAGMTEKGKLYMLTATRDYFVKILDPHMKRADSQLVQAFLTDMERTREEIEKSDRVKLSRLSNPNNFVPTYVPVVDDDPDVDPDVDPDDGTGDDDPSGETGDEPDPDSPTTSPDDTTPDDDVPPNGDDPEASDSPADESPAAESSKTSD